MAASVDYPMAVNGWADKDKREVTFRTGRSESVKTRTFETTTGHTLKIKSRRSAVIFEIEKGHSNKHYQFWFDFNPNDFIELIRYIEEISNDSWVNLSPKETDSLGSDYYEYYDKELDNNGYLSIKQNGLLIERPSLESEKLYQFNKKKMESFIYDLRGQ
jgi:hypothetical protein